MPCFGECLTNLRGPGASSSWCMARATRSCSRSKASPRFQTAEKKYLFAQRLQPENASSCKVRRRHRVLRVRLRERAHSRSPAHGQIQCVPQEESHIHLAAAIAGAAAHVGARRDGGRGDLTPARGVVPGASLLVSLDHDAFVERVLLGSPSETLEQITDVVAVLDGGCAARAPRAVRAARGRRGAAPRGGRGRAGAARRGGPRARRRARAL